MLLLALLVKCFIGKVKTLSLHNCPHNTFLSRHVRCAYGAILLVRIMGEVGGMGGSKLSDHMRIVLKTLRPDSQVIPCARAQMVPNITFLLLDV